MHHFFSHQDHGLSRQFAIFPILARIEQRAELADLVLKGQQLIGDAFRRSPDDQFVADRFQRDVIIRLIASGLE